MPELKHHSFTRRQIQEHGFDLRPQLPAQQTPLRIAVRPLFSQAVNAVERPLAGFHNR
jgi:hypothetical protein